VLASNPIDPMILATDLAVAREFYGERIGLELLLESDDFLTFKCGGDSRLVVTRSSTGTTEGQTKASWRVSDLAGEVSELRSRGVAVQELDEPGLKTVDGTPTSASLWPPGSSTRMETRSACCSSRTRR
jgi:hypothetical protein